MNYTAVYLIEVAKIILFYELSKRTLLWLINYTKEEFDMDNLQQSAEIRRAVENVGYKLIENAPPPTPKHDGDSLYMEEHWEIDFDTLHAETALHLYDRGMEVQEGSLADGQIRFHCKQFLASEEYEGMIKEQRQALIEEREEEKYQAAHQPKIPTNVG